MARVLGLSFFFHDSAAALVSGGRIVSAAAEERFSRRKHTNEFPKRAIEYCLEAGGLRTINDLDAIVFYEKPLLKTYRILETLVSVWPRGLVTFSRRLPHYLQAKFDVRRAIEESLPSYRGPIFFSEHHASHAASAFFCSPFREASILTIDGVGEWETTTVGVGRDRTINLDRAICFPHSIGLLYSALTSYLGFRVNDAEWKVMGLAPYGEPRYVDQFRHLVDMRPDGSFQLAMEYFVHHYSSRWTAHNERWRRLFGFERRDPQGDIEHHHEDLARSGQVVVEELVLNLAREAKRSSGCENLVVAGGVGLNSVANWKIEAEGIFRNVWIQPAAGDDGGALGAALLVSQQCFDDPRPAEMVDTYLGPGFSQEDIDDFLNSGQILHERYEPEPLVEAVADLIAAGKVVGWFQGRMEFGPRALGSRSILADATNPAMKDLINSKIKYREYFRPFAPAIMLEHVHEYFEVAPGTQMPFMLKVPPVRRDKRDVIPAVTHEDGTGRVQTVTHEGNPLYYNLIKAVAKRTGVPVIVNTSFNVRGEPIVCSPKDAWSCFVRTGIDALVLGQCVLTAKPERAADAVEGFARSDALEAGLGDADSSRSPMSGTVVGIGTSPTGREETTDAVLAFYKELPFNFYSNAVDTAVGLRKSNRVREYRPLDRFLSSRPGARVIDVGCGAGWFANSCAHFYESDVVGVDLNPTALRQARAVARLMEGGESVQYVKANVFEYEPGALFDVVNSLGVLHHTPDCEGAIRRVLKWVAPDGYLHLGLYHKYGREPFLDHFRELRDRGASEDEMLEEFAQLNPNMTDRVHLVSWFRDQVLHPHETQHTYQEIHSLLADEGFVVEATSINRFRALPSLSALLEMERAMTGTSKKALKRKRRYVPGFFVVWARRP